MTDTDRFISPCALPEGDVRELLTILAEECCEVAQRCTKALRFGVEEVQPGQSRTNGDRIGLEVGDFMEVAARLMEMGIVPEWSVEAGRQAKSAQLAKYMQSAPTNDEMKS